MHWTEKSLFSIHLNTSFPVDTILYADSYNVTTSSAVEYTGGGSFWSDLNQTRLYSMAGFPDSTVEGQSNMQTYDPAHDAWSTTTVGDGKEPYNKLERSQAMYANTLDGGGTLSFIAGGNDWLPGLVIMNSSNPQNPTWLNVTDNNTPYFWGPTTQYVRMGQQGILVSVGGYDNFGQTVQRNMSAVQVYDIASGKWSVVTATGDIPSSRSEFCSALSAASDDSSFQMTIYGGWNLDNNRALEDVYVLTMPAFQWIKISDTGNNETKLAKNAGKRRHFCNSYEDRSMIVLGGAVLHDDTAFDLQQCNSSLPPIKLLDTSTYQWHSQFPLPDPKYQVPSSVIDVVGGDMNGGGKPASTWHSGAELDLFAKTIPRYNYSHPTTSVSTQDGSAATGSGPAVSATSSGSSSSSTPVGAIVGGVVGGVAGLAISAALVYFACVYRRRNKTKAMPEVEKPELPHESPQPSFAPQRPTFQTHEVYGTDPDVFKPRELGGGQGIHPEALNRQVAEAPTEMERPVDTAKELPGVPIPR